MKNLITRKEKLIYLAAMIDGEGSIGIEKMSPCKVKRRGKESWQRKKNYYTCRLCVINTYKPLMDWLQKEFNGGTMTVKSKQTEKRKLCYKWQIFGKHMENLLNELIPFLFEKKPQAEVLLEYRKTVGKTGWNVSDEILQQREQFWLKCKSLNKTGPKN